MTPQPVSFALLGQLAPKSPVLMLEGTLVTLNDVKRGTGQHGDWALQGGVLKEAGTGAKHDVTFMGEEYLQHPDMVGKFIRISAQDYKGKMKGVVLDERVSNGKAYRAVQVKFPATVDIVQQANSPVTERPRQQQPSAPCGDDTVEKRVADWFHIYSVVLDAADNANVRQTVLAPEQLVAITTTMYLSFKEGYIHHPPVFQQDTSELQAKQEALLERSGKVTQELEQMGRQEQGHSQRSSVQSTGYRQPQTGKGGEDWDSEEIPFRQPHYLSVGGW